ncbi:ThuA domain-containing protein [Mucilaginibacter sp. L3T2-6]|uniref:ThuA domain-containing protein n=1 Tax=Mucilaginibacter sp. L3T2-6 TaxID=3062491 RepID=UPI0026763A82|nr:ThuA domain-containing protein [Mucilaginibacter sp. L3T2-6]MDO3642381.1 ThuA domain-containing protein [Mucilaginibacter sp. L3T2-6]MDV6214876.1 ThuA domain-containing protein [Mucilaginibacter sp. L3T2-6]
MKKVTLIIGISLLCLCSAFAQKKPRFKVIALYENGGHHIEYSKRAKIWLDSLAVAEHFSIDYIQNTDKIDDAFLESYQLFLQLDYAPYGWKEKAVKAFENYIEQGKGGWVGLHHATLLGEFDGYPMWQWFSKFMGSTRYKNYIATFVKAKVNIEDKTHPVTRGVSPSFIVEKEEFYTYEKSMRPNVHVLASVDESTYQPNSDTKMGDHPVIWTNPHYKARNIYIFMGHSPVLFNSTDYKTLLKNAIFWAAGK